MGTSNIAQVGVNHNCELRPAVASCVSCRWCLARMASHPVAPPVLDPCSADASEWWAVLGSNQSRFGSHCASRPGAGAVGSDGALRALQALDHGAGCYPVYRLVRSATRRPVEELFDDLALRSGLAAHRLGETALLLDGAGVIVSVCGRRKTEYSSLTFAIWADASRRFENPRTQLLPTRPYRKQFIDGGRYWDRTSGPCRVKRRYGAYGSTICERRPQLQQALGIT
jgi:hypothetical protein